MEAYFNVHFFKERNRNLDIDHLMSFFGVLEGANIEIQDSEILIDYQMPRLGYGARFLITKKSRVPNISRLSPKFLDLNFHLEIPLLTPDYVAHKLFEIVKEIQMTFELHIYSEMFEDVLPFKMDLLIKAFSIAKEAFINKNPSIMQQYNIVDKVVLGNILRYYDEMYSLQMYYKEQETYVPNYLFLKDSSGTIHPGFEWKEKTSTVFPPNTEFIVYITSEGKLLLVDEVEDILGKYLLDVPGFIKNTKVTGSKVKKIHKLVKKMKPTKVNEEFSRVNLSTLID
ncbi:hypothetical protein LJC17_00960 [Acholeplasma sp. OttesenSCG-928-E16]|nr:hypothetical protein [Acholeplasma sp. OttesenSCG-928-E16]